MKIVLLSIIAALIATTTVIAHDTGIPHDEPAGEKYATANSNDFSAILPFSYIAQGRWVPAILYTVLWLLLIKGIYELTLIIIGRLSAK